MGGGGGDMGCIIHLRERENLTIRKSPNLSLYVQFMMTDGLAIAVSLLINKKGQAVHTIDSMN